MAVLASAVVSNPKLDDAVLILGYGGVLKPFAEGLLRHNPNLPVRVGYSAAPDSDGPTVEQTSDLLAAIVNSADDAIISKNSAGIITSWNKGAERIFGYRREEAVGQHITLIVPNELWNEEAENLERLRQGERITNLQTMRKAKGGKAIHVSLTISPIRNAKGQIVGASKIARDISQGVDDERSLRESEGRFRRLSEALESVVRARTRELQVISSRLLKAEDEERRHLARELHDSAGQTLVVLALKISQVIEMAREDSPQIASHLQGIQETVQQLDQEIRTTSYLLHPPLLDEAGLHASLKWYVDGLSQRSGLNVRLEMREDFGRIAHEVELLVFRIVQECLTNTLRHSGAKNATIRIARLDDGIDVEISDDGTGIPDEKLWQIESGASGVGMRGMRERVRQLDGRMKIESGSSGTKVVVHLPNRQDL